MKKATSVLMVIMLLVMVVLQAVNLTVPPTIMQQTQHLLIRNQKLFLS